MRILAAVLCVCMSVMIIQAQDPTPPALSTPATGTFWYGIYGPDGKAEGYSRLVLRKTATGGIHAERDLHFAFTGGSYEEERAATFDANGRLTFTEFKSGDTRLLAARAGYVMVGKSGFDDLRVEVSEDATTGLGSVVAAMLPLQEGAKHPGTEYNESDGMALVGPYNMTVGAMEKLKLPEGEVEARKVTIARKSTPLAVWVNAAREIVQIDSGGGRLAKLHREPTTHLFKPKPPAFKQLEADNLKQITLEGEFAGFTLTRMFEHWTKPEQLTRWWPPKAEIEPKVGGKYVLTWTDDKGKVRWQLDSRVTAFEADKRFGFTWTWAGTENPTNIAVMVEFTEVAGGVKLRITHGPFGAGEDEQQARASVLQGWQFFGAKLASIAP